MRGLQFRPFTTLPWTPHGTTRQACLLMRLFLVDAAPTPCRWLPMPATGWRACTWQRPWALKPPPPSLANKASCAAIPLPCCPLPATTWATTSSTGCIWAKKWPLPAPSCPAFSRPTGSARAPTESLCGQATAKTCACSSGSLTALKTPRPGKNTSMASALTLMSCNGRA